MEQEYWQRLRDRGVVVIGINTGETGDPMMKAREFQAKHGLTYPILVDRSGDARAAFRVRGFPTNVILDRAGVVRYAGAGFNRMALDEALRRLAANQTGSPPQ